ncbi:hypothetical protein AXG93_1881s1170 [Marchantia polymorpha subsp. ruderalis]|uniref:Uncharacterized protein n=1 Tax=Marchantia polymorpha subsp. ruderalis TaxID=1480154 RepID=A0A176W6S1_MARPO|nr:hypothetical protein AXG93_1881s1170 [Marchantia polymorpha subsp. ruderalis]
MERSPCGDEDLGTCSTVCTRGGSLILRSHGFFSRLGKIPTSRKNVSMNRRQGGGWGIPPSTRLGYEVDNDMITNLLAAMSTIKVTPTTSRLVVLVVVVAIGAQGGGGILTGDSELSLHRKPEGLLNQEARCALSSRRL